LVLLPLLLLLLLLDALLAPRLSLLKLQCGLVAGLNSVNDQQPAIISRAYRRQGGQQHGRTLC
jgi:hypothetical protein